VLNFDTYAWWDAVVSFRLHVVSADKSDMFSYSDILFVKALCHVFVAGSKKKIGRNFSESAKSVAGEGFEPTTCGL
jgi:hypothetical protein